MIDHLNGSEIAIIGMSCRFPGAKSIDEFWQILRDGVETTSFLSDKELERTNIDLAAQDHSNYVKASPIVEDVDLFDATFFGYTPKEAEIMDPQHRLFLECAWEAFEHAGYDAEAFQGAIGVYCGARTNTYLFNLFSNREAIRGLNAFEIGIGNDLAFLSARIAYKMNLRGPAYSIHTACSTGLVAVHLACQSLLLSECQMALAGGIAINVPQKVGYLYQPGSILSPDGHCRAFDAKAAGTVFGSGVGIVLLKRFEDAVQDGDEIHAIIKGSATNNDGYSKASFTAPSIEGQTSVILEAMATADVNAASISYIEAHGTGTHLGDPIEIHALTKAFRYHTDRNGFCAIGSAKTNFGHLDAAAGMAGLIKTVLAFKYKMLPPNLHFSEPNPNIDFTNSPFYVNTTLSEWTVEQGMRRAGISSFGIGGTNVHIILEESPSVESGKSIKPWQLLLLSAKTNSALNTATSTLAHYLKTHPELNLPDVAYTLHIGRKAFEHRRIILCQNVHDATHALESLDPERVFTDIQRIGDPSAVFMFPGQGVQYVNMALDLYLAEPIFRNQIDMCSELLIPHLGIDLRTILYPSEAQYLEATQLLTQTQIAQPLLFVFEYALAQLWMAWGINPRAMIGHSIGEYVAACLARVFALEDALEVVTIRGRMMQELPEGAMLAVALDKDAIQPFLGKHISLGAINGPRQCVVAGSPSAICDLEQLLAKQQITFRRLQGSHAFHSSLMDSIIEPFAEQVERFSLHPPQIPYISNVTGTWATATDTMNPMYWAQHLRQPVRFSQGIQELLEEQEHVLLEVGPGQTLSRLVKSGLAKQDTLPILTSVAQRRSEQQGAPQSDVAFILTTLGRLWLAGFQIDGARFYSHEQRRRLPLPTYPFERQRYWIEAKDQTEEVKRQYSNASKRSDISKWFYIPSWKRCTLLKVAQEYKATDRPLNWLIFSNKDYLSTQFVDLLRQKGQHVITVTAGEQFHQNSDDTYTIHPGARSDYVTLFTKLRSLHKIPDKIGHFWSVTPQDLNSPAIQTFDQAQFLGFYSLMFVAQIIGELNITDPLQILVISNSLHQVTGEEVGLRPEKSTILGACKVISKEYSNISCCQIDIIVPELENAQNELVSQLVEEIASPSNDLIVAYRGHYRWIPTFEAVQLDPVQLDRSGKESAPLRKNGVYLITGGLGGIGFIIAEYLARSVSAKLILTGRTVLPERHEWQQWLENHDAQDNVSRKIQKVRSLESLGAEVLVVEADVANLQQMQFAITEGLRRFDELHGVIHAAGVAGSGIVQLKTIEAVEAVLAPKAKGLFVLDLLLQGMQIDFLLLFSSISAVLGEVGQVDYCAANIVLDTFAHTKLAQNGTCVTSVNWSAWSEVGMTIESLENTTIPSEILARLKHEIQDGITSTEGIEVVLRILSRNIFPQVIVSPRDLQAQIEELDILTEFIQSSTQDLGSKPTHQRPNLQNPYIAPTNETQRIVADIWQEILGIEQVGIYDDFFELGGHSLLATTVSGRLYEAFGMEVPVGALFETPSVAGLAQCIQNMQTEQEDQGRLKMLQMLAQLTEEEVEDEIRRRQISL